MRRFRRLSITQGIFALTLAIAIAVAGTIILYTRHRAASRRWWSRTS